MKRRVRCNPAIEHANWLRMHYTGIHLVTFDFYLVTFELSTTQQIAENLRHPNDRLDDRNSEHTFHVLGRSIDSWCGNAPI